MTLSTDLHHRTRTASHATLVRRSVRHSGPCGERHDPPCGDLSWRPYQAAETLANGDVACHECGNRWRPSEPVWCNRGRLTRAELP